MGPMKAGSNLCQSSPHFTANMYNLQLLYFLGGLFPRPPPEGIPGDLLGALDGGLVLPLLDFDIIDLPLVNGKIEIIHYY